MSQRTCSGQQGHDDDQKCFRKTISTWATKTAVEVNFELKNHYNVIDSGRKSHPDQRGDSNLACTPYIFD